MNHLSLSLKPLLHRRGMSQDHLARVIGHSRPTVCRICNGKYPATRRSVLAIADALAKTRRERLELVLAHLHDELRAFGLTPAEINSIFPAPVPVKRYTVRK